MELLNILCDEFRHYGRVSADYDCEPLMRAMGAVPMLPEVVYKPSVKGLEELDIFRELSQGEFGGMPIQLGYCAGHNRRMNAMEFHKSSEWNLACTDLVLFLGKRQDIDEKTLTWNSSLGKAFYVPAGTAFETYATTLHYAPLSYEEKGFRLVVALPRGTNLPLEGGDPGRTGEKRLMAARNKWVLAHPDLENEGLYIGIRGENVKL